LNAMYLITPPSFVVICSAIRMRYRAVVDIEPEFVNPVESTSSSLPLRARAKIEISNLISSASERNRSCVWGRTRSVSRSRVLGGLESKASSLPLSRAHVRRGGTRGRFGVSGELGGG
jgi:hypothetical protein